MKETDECDEKGGWWFGAQMGFGEDLDTIK